ncbi:MAG: hypothetical protein K6A23_06130 [Butyrivibrio sp.]|nr:hypothetical protein [Butyrivibrio sp.]
MAYFDSEKNRAMWQRHLSDLEVEKNRRKQEGYKPQTNKTSIAEKKEEKIGVRVISFEQLVAKEAERARIRKEIARSRQLEARKQMQKDQKVL